MSSDYRNRGWNDDNDDDERMRRPSGGGGVGSSSIAYESGHRNTGRRRIIMVVVALLVLGGFGAVVWNAYDQGQRSGGVGVVPLIQADKSPTKIRPEEPGGLDVPNQDKLIYDRLTPGQNSASGVERLLPAPEAPVARPEAPAIPAAPPESMLAEGVTAAPRQPVQRSGELEPPTIATRPPATGAPTALAPSRPQPTPNAPTPQPQAAVPTPAPQANVASLPREKAPAGGVKVQLGAVRAQDAAEKEWARLQKANTDLLGKLSLNVSQANLGERGIFYRIQAGPLADQQAAGDLCAKLKTRNVSCIVVR